MSEQSKEFSWIDYLKSVDTPTLANAIERLRVRSHREGFTPLQVRDLFPEFGRMCGYAVTAQVETITESDAMHNTCFVELLRAVEASKKPRLSPFRKLAGTGTLRPIAARSWQRCLSGWERLAW